ncbi:hypothetical protein ACWKSP_23790 [Micromonosporaceae bacterium Da 78-11]
MTDEAIEANTSHRARRPSWDCVVCQETWPCAPAKVDMSEEYVNDRLSLMLYLSIKLIDAIDDSFGNQGPRAVNLHDRIVGWAFSLPSRGGASGAS